MAVSGLISLMSSEVGGNCVSCRLQRTVAKLAAPVRMYYGGVRIWRGRMVGLAVPLPSEPRPLKSAEVLAKLFP